MALKNANLAREQWKAKLALGVHKTALVPLL